jgi:hypothetical protein
VTPWLEAALEAVVEAARLRDSFVGCEQRDEALQRGEGRDGRSVLVSAVYRTPLRVEPMDVRPGNDGGRPTMSVAVQGTGGSYLAPYRRRKPKRR